MSKGNRAERTVRIVLVVVDHGFEEGEDEDSDGPYACADAAHMATNSARSRKREGKRSTLRG